MIIRRAEAGDLTAMMDIELQVFPGTAWSTEQMADELARTADTRWYAVAESEGLVVGYVGLYVSTPDADVQTVAVAKSHQGGGVGRRLVAAAIDHAWQVGCARIFLEVRADNEPALTLYATEGFVRMGRRSRYYPDGTDAITMRLRRHEVPDLQESAHVG